ncbi:uncharacterized protein LOC142327547 [Lycorma delicatula]|uniref:uncharacterized protein LOC142327547 n=1 Tax=Lycorma delicatula TaxID=130591 RepID=UPI003F516907
MDHHILIFISLTALSVIVSAQFPVDDFGGAPVPRRPVIPGAVPVGGGPQFRAQPRRFPPSQLVSDPVPPPIKIRRPSGRIGRLNGPPQARPLPVAPQPQPQPVNDIQIPPRPVIEDPEEQQSIEQQLNSFQDVSPSPAPHSEPIGQSPQPQPAQIRPGPRPPLPSSPAAFRPERPAFIPTPSPDIDFPTPTRQQFRTTAAPVQSAPTPIQQFSRQQPSRQQIVQQQQVVRNQPQKQQPQQFVKQFQERERDREAPIRVKKPVAQVLRRYREDNEDGSITWGFENDDGSFKEETIGVDCITRGKYGYVDPDGVRREYTYSSGIPCDKTKDDKDNQGAATNDGYIDYQNNRYVLPNGDEVDLDKMVKNRARKPAPYYRN